MDKDQRDEKKFLEEQLQWTKDQARILDEIDKKLHEMKEIAVYARDRDLSTGEAERLNRQLSELKEEIVELEKQLQSVVH